MAKKIRLAVNGVGNCASSLLQGIVYYDRQKRQKKREEHLGLMHYWIGPYAPGDIEVVAAFDIDRRKVGQTIDKAIFAPPNCTKDIVRPMPKSKIKVQMAEVLDGYAEHMKEFPPDQRFEPAKLKPVKLAKVLKDTGTEILVNYLPVGSQKATEIVATACLEAGVSLVNCIPVFIVSNTTWGAEFAKQGIPCVGDDIKAQIGATIVHRTLTRLFVERGAAIDGTYQLNVGGNTDFMNMLKRERLISKKISKTEAVTSQLDEPIPADHVHIGPADYIPWIKDNKICFLRMEGRGFAGIPLNLELRLSVEDSPNSAGVAIDAIRCCKLARDRGVAGPLTSISSYTMKHPPQQFTDNVARQMVEDFILGQRER
ncbi:MAG: inositol-3-phosphate synthase [Planctomycetes bacterium]|nr:inositol-3-phosphate synthase [Planctomycetota bacterium]